MVDIMNSTGTGQEQTPLQEYISACTDTMTSYEYSGKADKFLSPI